jgi:hypothetical protein
VEQETPVKKSLETTDLHTILRPTNGHIGAQGVKGKRVIFLIINPPAKTPQHQRNLYMIIEQRPSHFKEKTRLK